jgi:hypothetical protein
VTYPHAVLPRVATFFINYKSEIEPKVYHTDERKISQQTCVIKDNGSINKFQNEFAVNLGCEAHENPKNFQNTFKTVQ